MGLRKKNVQPITDFNAEQPITGGNSFDVAIKLKMQKEINNSTGAWNIGVTPETMNTINQFIDDTVPHWWIMLKEQANYFCNQFQWKVEDIVIKNIIINTIRCSFYNGIAGVYYNDISQEFEAVALSNVEYTANGQPKRAKYTLANVYLDGVNTDQREFAGEHNIPETKINNLAIFKWGTEGINAWLRILPYVKLQHMLQTMLTTQSFAFVKKFEYICNDPKAAVEEMKHFFNPRNLFIVRAGFQNDTLNRFNQLDVGNSNSVLQMVEYYKEIMGIIYQQLGRRLNVDTKKERNLSNEIDASQENFDIIFKDTNTQFNMFVERLNTILKIKGIKPVEIVLQDVIEEQEGLVDEVKRSFSEAGRNGDN